MTSTHTEERQSLQTSGLFTAARAIAVAPLKLLRTWQRRRALSHLARFDERMLRDIGVTRQDLASALSASLLCDPTIDLARRANENRRARRAQAIERKQATRFF